MGDIIKFEKPRRKLVGGKLRKGKKSLLGRLVKPFALVIHHLVLALAVFAAVTMRFLGPMIMILAGIAFLGLLGMGGYGFYHHWATSHLVWTGIAALAVAILPYEYWAVFRLLNAGITRLGGSPIRYPAHDQAA